MDDLSWTIREELLRGLSLLARTGRAENQEASAFRSTFYPVQEHVRAFDPDAAFVVGTAGSGKSTLCRALVQEGLFPAIAERLQDRRLAAVDPRQTWWLAGNRTDSVPETLADLDPAVGKVWPLLQTSQIIKASPVQNLEQSDMLAAIEALDARLAQEDGWLFVAYDGLDTQTDRGWQEAVSAALRLVTFWAQHTRRWHRVRAKLFMRPELFHTCVRALPANLASFAAGRVDLAWNDRALYAMLIRHTVDASDALQELSRATGVSFDRHGELGLLPRVAAADDAMPFVERMLGAFMGEGAKRIRASTWITDRVRDGNDAPAPGALLLLLGNAAEQELRAPRATEDRLISPSALQRGLPSMSVDYVVRFVTAESPWISGLANRLAETIVPAERQQMERLLAQKWRGSWGSGGTRPPAVTAAELVDHLLTAGILRQRADGRLDATDLFLHGLKLKRGGGVESLVTIKGRLKATVVLLRKLLEEDLGRQLKRLGIEATGREVKPLASLRHLTDDEMRAGRALEAALARELGAAPSYAAAVEAIRREAVYTHLNRLVGLKCLELRGHLAIEGEPTEAVTCRAEYGGRPKWLWTLREREKRFRFGEDAEELLWREGLRRAWEAVDNSGIHVLFDPADPYAQLWPSHKVLREVVDALNALPDDAFRSDEILGWVYQYFQSNEKDRVFENVRTKKRKIAGPDIIPVTQLYTEHYMVDFLLQNSLGARWMEMYPDSDLKTDWPYYVTPASPHMRPRKPVKEWLLLDPCVGSGHFHVVAFDLFVQLYAEERRLAAAGIIPAEWTVPEEEVAVTILERNLHGIDIDPRAVQLATLALYLKAKEAGLAWSPRINIVAADASFLRGEAWERFLASLKDEPGLQKILAQMAESLVNIRELGSLLRPEVELQRIVREVHAEWETRGRRKAEQALLFPELAAGMQLGLPLEDLTDEAFWDAMTRRAEQEIHAYVDSARQRGEIVDQVVAGEAARGFAFLALCRQRYDVVCTNPPYMGSGNMGDLLSRFISDQYASGKRDLYAAFILRCTDLARCDGHVAMVTQQSWMFLRSYAGLRAASDVRLPQLKTRGEFTGLLRETSIETLVHLGEHAFADPAAAGAFVAIFTLRKYPPTSEHRFTALRLIGPKSAEEKAALMSEGKSRRFESPQNMLVNLDESPLVYWLSDGLLDLLDRHGRPTPEDRVYVSQGLTTGNVPRFVRFFWECRVSAPEWVWYTAGGGYKKWAGNEYLVVDWEDDGRRVKEYVTATYPPEKYSLLIKQPETFGRRAVYYGAVARGSLGPRLCEGAIFGDSAPGVIYSKLEPITLAGILSSRLMSFLVRALSSSILTIRDAYVIRLPLYDDPLSAPIVDRISNASSICLSLKRFSVAATPTERTFHDTTVPKLLIGSEAQDDERIDAILLTTEGRVDRLVFQGFDVDEASESGIVEETGKSVSWNPLLPEYDTMPVLSPQVTNGLPSAWPSMISDCLSNHPRLPLDSSDVERIKARLRTLYLLGPGSQVDGTDGDSTNTQHSEAEEDTDAASLGAYIPIPVETYLEELSQKLEIHPISVYWLLEELRREEGLVCPPELKRQTEDYVSVKLLRMLGHRWPMQDQYEHEQGHPFLDPRWLDDDGIIPLTPSTGDAILADRFARFLDAEFGEVPGHAVEVEAGQILGWKPGDEWGKQKPTSLARWFEREFFRRHVSQFKRRPSAWHLSSPRGAFQAIIYYHKFDKNRLALLRARYVRNVIESLRHELAEAGSASQDRATLNRIAALEAQLTDVQEFDARLQRLQEGRDREARIWCPWKSPAEQSVGWDPDINDGVRVNIAPVQRLGLLAADVLAAKDLKSLLAPEGRG